MEKPTPGLVSLNGQNNIQMLDSVETSEKIHCGVYVPPSVFQRCVTICEEWPSWLSICGTCEFICEAIYVVNVNHFMGQKTEKKECDGASSELEES